jgi:hypothetical protein
MAVFRFRDGSTRDPAAIAALHGIFLNRGDNYELAVARPDVEGSVTRTVAEATAWLADSAAPFEVGVGLLDMLGNLGESSLVLPLAVPLSARARQLAAGGYGATARTMVVSLLRDQVGALNATKMGAEQEPGVCTFSRAPTH